MDRATWDAQVSPLDPVAVLAAFDSIAAKDKNGRVKWEAVNVALGVKDWTDGTAPDTRAADAALNALMDRGIIYEPTLGILARCC